MPLAKVRNLSDDRRERLMCCSHVAGCVGSAGEGVENAALRVGSEERLRLMLPMEVDEESSDLGKQASVHGRTVDPGARSASCDFSLQDNCGFFDVDSAFIEQRSNLSSIRHVEHTFDRGLIRARSKDDRAGAIAEQKTERPNDKRYAD